MASLRFPFSFFRRSLGHTGRNAPPVSAATAAAAAAVGVGTSLAVAATWTIPVDPSRPNPWARPSPAWASLSLSDAATDTSVEPRTGAAFPSVVDGDRRLLGVGLRRKCLLGLKNIDVYAFGVYVNGDDIKQLKEKYGAYSVSELKDNRKFYSDVLGEDIRMTVRLQIVYGRLSIRSVRNAFEESVGNRLKKFSSSDNKELLHRFTSIFKDEFKIPKGCHIDLSREQGHNLHMKIDGKEVGCIQSQLLCRSLFDLYVGEEPFDRKAKEDYDIGLASLLQD